MRYCMRYRKKCDIACDIAWDIASGPIVDNSKYAISHAISHAISIKMRYRMRYRMIYRMRYPYDAISNGFPLRYRVRYSHLCLLCVLAQAAAAAMLPLLLLLLPRCLHRGTAGWWSWCLAARIGSSWNGYNARLLPCSWRKWNGTACLSRLQTRIWADTTVWLSFEISHLAWQQPGCLFKFKFRLSTRMSCPSNGHGTGTSNLASRTPSSCVG